ncbi:MAG TPA: hypothetical protein VGO47_03410, partial [Chlamydiales bacterium]|nr:hypothetical protein [Chlamydiales bacterium]
LGSIITRGKLSRWCTDYGVADGGSLGLGKDYAGRPFIIYLLLHRRNMVDSNIFCLWVQVYKHELGYHASKFKSSFESVMANNLSDWATTWLFIYGGSTVKNDPVSA